MNETKRPQTAGKPSPVPRLEGACTAAAHAGMWDCFSSPAAMGELQRFVAGRVKCIADADDILQQTLLQAHAHSASCLGTNRRAWVFTIARHLIVDYYRARGKPESLHLERPCPIHPEMVRAACFCRERLEWCARCVHRELSVEHRVAVLLADFHGYSDKESAQALRMSVPRFKLMLHQARAALHQCAGGQCPLVSKLGTGASCRGGLEECAGTPPASSLHGVSARASNGLPTEALSALSARLMDGLGLED